MTSQISLLSQAADHTDLNRVLDGIVSSTAVDSGFGNGSVVGINSENNDGLTFENYESVPADVWNDDELFQHQLLLSSTQSLLYPTDLMTPLATSNEPLNSNSNIAELGGGEVNIITPNSSLDNHMVDALISEIQVPNHVEPANEILTPPPTPIENEIQSIQPLTEELKKCFLKKIIEKFGKDGLFSKSCLSNSISSRKRYPACVFDQFFQIFEEIGFFIKMQNNRFVVNCYEFPIINSHFRDYENGIIQSSSDLANILLDQNNYVDRNEMDLNLKTIYYIYKYIKSKNPQQTSFRFNFRNFRESHFFSLLGFQNQRAVKENLNQSVSAGLLTRHSINEFELNPSLFQ